MIKGKIGEIRFFNDDVCIINNQQMTFLKNEYWVDGEPGGRTVLTVGGGTIYIGHGVEVEFERWVDRPVHDAILHLHGHALGTENCLTKRGEGNERSIRK